MQYWYYMFLSRQKYIISAIFLPCAFTISW